jgi:hypothetical protein
MINYFLQKVISDPEKTLNIIIRDAVREELSKISDQLAPRQVDSIEYLNRKDAAALLQISNTQLYYLRKKGIVNCYRIGAKVYFKKSDLLNSFKSSDPRINRKGGKHEC